MSLSNCVKYEKNIHPMSLIKIEFLAYFRQKRLLSLHAKKAPHSRISLDIQFCQSSVWHCALRRTLTSVLINNVLSDAYMPVLRDTVRKI